ncbi:MAG: hypothetical protein PVJ19_16665, partial [Desulfobacteraceae bacterium]
QRHTGLHHRPSSVRRYSLAFTIPQSSSTLVLSSPDIETGTEYTTYTGGTASGNETFYGLYLGDLSYFDGTAGTSFTVSSTTNQYQQTPLKDRPGQTGIKQPYRLLADAMGSTAQNTITILSRPT